MILGGHRGKSDTEAHHEVMSELGYMYDPKSKKLSKYIKPNLKSNKSQIETKNTVKSKHCFIARSNPFELSTKETFGIEDLSQD